MPPTERRGRVHSSTVTVAALPLEERAALSLSPADLSIETMRGSGAGGQHRHATDSAVRIRHRPTGLEVRICAERSQHRNRQIALQLLQAKLEHAGSHSHHQQRDQLRRALVGTGERSDKVRTLRQKTNEVIDHRSGKRWALTEFLDGHIA